jgi:hypothetical protein
MHSDPIIRRVHACAIAHVPSLLIGAPGTGKTARVAAYAAAIAAHYERWLLSRCEPIDIKPRAITAKGEIVVSDAPEYARAKKAERAVLFFDEFNRCERGVEGAALDLLDSAPSHVVVIGAVNPPAPGQAARPLEAAAANRFCHLPVTADADTWATGMMTGFGASDTALAWPPEKELAPFAATSRARLTAYVRSRQDVLEKQPKDPIQAGGAWPSTRTWEYAIRAYAVALALSLDAEDTEALISGLLGGTVGSELFAYLVDPANALPDIEGILQDPSSWPIPIGRADMIIAVAGAVQAALQRKLTDARWKSAWGFISRAVEANETGAAAVANDLIIPILSQAAKEKVTLTPTTKLMPARLAAMVNAARARGGA